jgi:ribosome-associated toxin RatA of RatAB toxin-antitoxin module
MPTVTVVETLDVPADEVWACVVDVASYPEYMESVRTIEVLRSVARIGPDGGELHEAVVGWEIVLEDAVLRWVEREIRDPVRRRVDFEQISGDLAVFGGHWQVDRLDAGRTRVELSVRFEIGLEMLREILDPYAERAIRDNSQGMLSSLDQRARR